MMKQSMPKYIKSLFVLISVWLSIGFASFAEESEANSSGELTENVIEAAPHISELSNVECEFSKGSVYSYTGKTITPELVRITFTDAEGNVCEKFAEDISIVKYRNNTKIGKADVVITVNGYEGNMTIEDAFTIQFGKITSFKASPSSYKTIKLTWKQVPGADGYSIYRRVAGTKKYTTIKTITSGKTTSYSDSSKNLKLGKSYEYIARAYRNVNGKKVFSGYTAVVKQKLQVATPKITSAKASSYNSIKIEWKKVSGASGYAVYRSTSEKGTYERIGTVKKGTSYTDKKRTCGVTYYYKICAYRTSNSKNYYGSKSAMVSAKTVPAKTAYNSKTSYTAESITLKWNKSSGAQGYNIYIGDNPKSGFKLLKKITNVNTTTWTMKGLDKNTVYYYKIRPYTIVNGGTVYGTYSSAYEKSVIPQEIIEIQKYTNVKYVSGGRTTKGWDCSGFTQWAVKYISGKSIPKSSKQQAKAGMAVNKNDMNKWKAGDVLVYSDRGGVCHVGLYLGNGKMMHALNRKYGTIIQDVDYYERWDSGTKLTGVRRFF